MESAREILNKINDYEAAKNAVENCEVGIAEAKKNADIKVSKVVETLQSRINSGKFKEFFNLVLKLHKDKITYDKYGETLSLRGNRVSLPITEDNFAEIAEKAWKLMTQNWEIATFSAAENFCCGYNTAMTLFSDKDRIAKKLAEKETDNIRQTIEKKKKFIADCENSCIFARNNPNRGGESISKEGVVILGTQNEILSAEEMKKFKEYGYDERDLQTPIELSCKKGHGSIILDASDKEKTQARLFDFLQSVFYKNMLRFKPGEFSIAAIERDRGMYNALDQLTFALTTASKNKPLYPDYVYKITYDDGDISYNKNETDAFLAESKTDKAAKLLSSLSFEIKARRHFFNNPNQPEYPNITEYNKNNLHNAFQYILLIVNGYPEDLQERSYSGVQQKFTDELTYIVENGAEYGIFTLIISENTVVNYYDKERESWNSDVLKQSARSFDFEDESGRFNWIGGVSANEKEQAVLTVLENVEQRNLLHLSDMLKTIEFEKPTNGAEICIPVGLSDGKPYYFATSFDQSNAKKMRGGVNALVLGGSGKGKSAFLRMLILSGAYYYSPDELQFYVIDFKSQTGTADFACFAQASTEENAYIPHVRFLSMESGIQHANQVLDLIQKIRNDRLALFRKNGCNDFYSYYKKVLAGEVAPLPAIYFIIDEFNNVFTKQNIATRLSECLNTVRSCGISIILSGQEMPSTVNYNNAENRIVFAVTDRSSFREGLGGDIKQEERQATNRAFSQISGRVGVAACVRKPAAVNKEIVKFAFDDGKTGRNHIAAEIRKKYADKKFDLLQMTPGSDEINSADNILKLNAKDREFYRDGTCFFNIGLSSLAALPVAIKLGKKLESETGGAKDSKFYQNYLAWLDSEKQQRLEIVLILTYAEYLKKKGMTNQKYISFNYEEFEDIEYVKNILRLSGAEIFVEMNETLFSMTNAIETTFELYSKRKAARMANKAEPYLLILHNAEWISEYDAKVSSKEKESYKSFEKKSIYDVNISDFSEKQNRFIKEEISSSPEMLGAFLSVVSRIEKKEHIEKEKSKKTGYSRDVLDYLSILMRNGGEQNVFVFILADSFNGLEMVADWDRWKAKVQRSLENQGQAIPIKNNSLFVGDIETRIFDYQNAQKWQDYFKKI